MKSNFKIFFIYAYSIVQKKKSRGLTKSLFLRIPQVVQGLDVLSVVHIVWILLRGEVETTDANVVWQQQHRWVSYTDSETLWTLVLIQYTFYTFYTDLCRGACERWSSHPEQHTLYRVAHRQRGNRQRKNTHSFPLCSCTPEDKCHTPHTRSRLRAKLRKLELVLEINFRSVFFFFFVD